MDKEKIFELLFKASSYNKKDSRSDQFKQLIKEPLIIDGKDQYFAKKANQSLQICHIDISQALTLRNFKLKTLKIDSVSFSKSLTIENSVTEDQLILKDCSIGGDLNLSNTTPKNIFLNKLNLNGSSIYINKLISNQNYFKIYQIEECDQFEITNSDIYGINTVDQHGNDNNNATGIGCINFKLTNSTISKDTDIGYILKDVSKVAIDTLTANCISFKPSNLVGDMEMFELTNSTVFHIDINTTTCRQYKIANNTINSLVAAIKNADYFNIIDQTSFETDLEAHISLTLEAESVSLVNVFSYKSVLFTNIKFIQNKLLLKNISLNTLKFTSTNSDFIASCKISLENIHTLITKNSYTWLSKLTKRDPFLKKGFTLVIKDLKVESNLTIKDSTISTINDSLMSYISSLNLLNVTFQEVPFKRVAVFEKKESFYENGDINISNCNFKEFDNEKAQTIYKKLKKICISNDYDYGTHLFHSLELEARFKTLKQYSLEHKLSIFSKIVNNYGEAFSRPIWWYLLITILFSVMYYSLDGLEPMKNVTQIPWLTSFIQKPFHYCQYFFYSFFNSILIFRFTDIGKVIHPNSLFVQLIAIFQTTISSILLYLFIVGIKKRFRQK